MLSLLARQMLGELQALRVIPAGFRSPDNHLFPPGSSVFQQEQQNYLESSLSIPFCQLGSHPSFEENTHFI